MTPELRAIIDEEHSTEMSPAYLAIVDDQDLFREIDPLIHSLMASIAEARLTRNDIPPSKVISSALGVALVTGIAIGRRDMGWTP